MRIFTAISGLLMAGAAFAQSSNQSSSCSPKSADVQTVQFAYALQYLSERFWSSQPLNQSFLQDAKNASKANYGPNFQGIQRQNRLGVRAVQQTGKSVSGFSAPRCNFTFPSSKDADAFVKTALQIESSVTGALIGLAGYTQAPEVSFLLARLAAEHGAHVAYIGAQQTPVIFPSNSSSLPPAWTPDHVLKNGTQIGQLGSYLKNCVSAPAAPCNQKFNIGPLVGSFNSTSSGSSASSSASPSSTPSSSGSSSSASSTASSTSRKRKYF
ncbi:hypothetical protein BDV25DRAFT_153245 [Aspergillus avenaceus]|uniref:Ferritin-like domain-containing protein n=1 Tax=Aspergillus avenaceus TaxID=36643 RepID=A0A5N6TXM3_ASPAV|nr:hypothetical protein BDV25DRAFT_153245 [Aspergillus avenaceus]